MKVNKSSREYEQRYELGQFFTCDDLVAKIVELFDIDFANKTVLEPSCGTGAFVNAACMCDKVKSITAVDIDKTIEEFYADKNVNFICGDFLTCKFSNKFDIVIGNPPFNLKTHTDYYDTTEGFVLKSLELLKPDGDLYLVLPSTVLRNKQYQPVREYIVKNCSILGIMDTSKYDFLGADIETIVLHIRNTKSDIQQYFYIKDDKKEDIYWVRNEQCTIHINNLTDFQAISKKLGTKTIDDLFDIHRGRSKSGQPVRGRDIDFYGCYYDNKSENRVIGIQNVAYRFTANVISSELDQIADTITILIPKTEMSLKELIFYSEYLNTSVANYLIHCDALNDCRLTIHMDKYYVKNITVPDYIEAKSWLDNVFENNGDFVLAKKRNEIFYEILNLSKSEIAKAEDKWTFPRYKTKSKMYRDRSFENRKNDRDMSGKGGITRDKT